MSGQHYIISYAKALFLVFLALPLVYGCSREDETIWPIRAQSRLLMTDTMMVRPYIGVMDTTDTIFIHYGKAVEGLRNDESYSYEMIDQSVTVSGGQIQDQWRVILTTLGYQQPDVLTITSNSAGTEPIFQIIIDGSMISPGLNTSFHDTLTVDSTNFNNVFVGQGGVDTELFYTVGRKIDAIMHQNQLYKRP